MTWDPLQSLPDTPSRLPPQEGRKARDWIGAVLREALPAPPERHVPVPLRWADLSSARTLEALPPESIEQIAIEILHLLAASGHRGLHERDYYVLHNLLVDILRKLLPRCAFDGSGAQLLAKTVSDSRGHNLWRLPLAPIFGAIERSATKHGLAEPLRQQLSALAGELTRLSSMAGERTLARRLQALLQGESGESTALPEPGEPWADTLRTGIEGLPVGQREAWYRLLRHARTASSAKPSKRWSDEARRLVEGVGKEGFADLVEAAALQIGKPAGRPIASCHEGVADPRLIEEVHGDLLRGLAWACGTLGDPRLAMSLGRLATACFRKIPEHGPLSAKVGNAALQGLSDQGTIEAVGQLSRLRSRIKHPSALKMLEGALSRLAARKGLTPEELEEMAVPEYGLTEVGRSVSTGEGEATGGWCGEIEVSGPSTVVLGWRGPGGEVRTAPPAAWAAVHKAEVQEIQTQSKEIRSALSSQRARLEGLLRRDRSWPLAVWRERYLDHPLVGVLARRLLWSFAGGERREVGFWMDGAVTGLDGVALLLGPETGVSLWHPIDSPPESVLAWRLRLEAEEVVQPFKQAHRETYLLTGAERETATYSNRFAAHIVRQHALHALCRERGWAYRLQGQWDSLNVPTLGLPHEGLVAEYLVEPPLVGAPETSAMGVFLYLITHQVRFRRPGGEPVLLSALAPRLFSEVMRDVDLFVGVCSLGSDPTWTADGNDFGATYWQESSFGELREQGETRRELLARLLPKLKIAGQCSLEERFLEVRGTLHTYKIHLGSGNILMAPDDRYLCIVRDPTAAFRTSHVQLPFEGDTTLSLILSKAFLLAEDGKINDPVILNQIRRS